LGKGINMSDRRNFTFFGLNFEIELSMRRKIVCFLLREYISKVMIVGAQTG
jgi:hypothetical protein